LPIDSLTDSPQPALLPYPARITAGNRSLRCGGKPQVDFSAARSDRLDRAVERFEAGLRRIGVKGDAGDDAVWRLQIACNATGAEHPQLGDAEAYRLSVGAHGVVVTAPCEWGVLHALNTLIQLVIAPGEKAFFKIPFCEIEDEPRFAWRGVLIDVARHFIGVEGLQRTLDGMALCKLNVLHLHLTDDQAFRFPSTRFPAVTSDEHFTRSELVDLVAYAADRGVRIVPEIDMPGHTNCWLVAYPDWTTNQTRTTRRFGVHEACLDPSNDLVYVALAALLSEVAAVFPDRHLHIGGDEVNPAWWSASASVQKFMADRAIPDIAALHAYFVGRVVEITTGLGRTAVGWDEVVHENLPASVLVQCWRGATARDRALARGNDCVVSSNYYLDLFYPAEVHYRFDPEADQATLMALEDELLDDPRFAHVAQGMRSTHHWRKSPAGAPAGVPASAGRSAPAGRIVGAEACLWSELVADPLLDVRLWSRLPALAERFWSPASVTDVDDLYVRLSACLRHLAAVSDIDIMGTSRRLLENAGVRDAWWPMVEVLEPLKWYGRLLGQEALSARIADTEMPQARPYDADTPLNRVVDGLLPESFAARRVAALCRDQIAGDKAAGRELERYAQSWQALGGQSDCLPELAASARLLEALGTMVIGVLNGAMGRESSIQILDRAAQPQGEYLIAVVPALRSWVEAGAP